MTAINTCTGMSLSRAPRNQPLKQGEWRAIVDGLEVWTGTVKIRLYSQEKVLQFHAAVHALAVEIGGVSATVSILSDFIDPSVAHLGQRAALLPPSSSGSSGVQPGNEEGPGQHGGPGP